MAASSSLRYGSRRPDRCSTAREVGHPHMVCPATGPDDGRVERRFAADQRFDDAEGPSCPRRPNLPEPMMTEGVQQSRPSAIESSPGMAARGWSASAAAWLFPLDAIFKTVGLRYGWLTLLFKGRRRRSGGSRPAQGRTSGLASGQARPGLSRLPRTRRGRPRRPLPARHPWRLPETERRTTSTCMA